MATTAQPTFASLTSEIKARRLAPVYLLHGEEGYFIDRLVEQFDTVLSDDEKEFNQYVLYAPQTEMLQAIDICRRYPMMADRQVVILKECQAARADQLSKLAKYVASPSPQTVLVICFRGQKAKGKELLDAVKTSKATVFESKKIYDSQIGAYISKLIQDKGLSVDPKALEMLKEYEGTDLSRLYNEIDKLTAILGPGAMVTPESIERNIGFSKDYNSFELVDALAARDMVRAFRIVDYFRANPKANPTVMVVASIFSYFSDLMITYFVKDRSEAAIMRALNIKNSFGMRRFNTGRRNYNAYQVIEIIRAIRRFAAQSKGCGSRQHEYLLLRELVFHILTAPGNLWQR